VLLMMILIAALAAFVGAAMSGASWLAAQMIAGIVAIDSASWVHGRALGGGHCR